MHVVHVVHTAEIKLTNFLEQSLSWNTTSSSASQEIPHILWKVDVHSCVHKKRPVVPVLSHNDSVHTLPSYCFMILQFMPASSKWSLSFRFSYKNPLCISHVFHTCNIPHPSHPVLFDYPYLVSSINHEGFHYAIFCSFLLLSLSWTQNTYINLARKTEGMKYIEDRAVTARAYLKMDCKEISCLPQGQKKH